MEALVGEGGGGELWTEVELMMSKKVISVKEPIFVLEAALILHDQHDDMLVKSAMDAGSLYMKSRNLTDLMRLTSGNE